MTNHEFERFVRECTEPSPAPRWLGLFVAALFCAAAWLLLLAGAW